MRGWQVALLMLLAAPGGVAGERPAFVWKAPQVGPGLFSEALGMLEREREEYATSLAVHAMNRVAAAGASAASLEEARRLLALSMHLASRNRRALVANYQLGRGIVPEASAGDYSPEVLARLLFTRAEILKQQGGAENLLLARAFVALAAEIDPKNEDAVYASELQRLDEGPFDWKRLTDVGPAPAGGPAAPPGGVP